MSNEEFQKAVLKSITELKNGIKDVKKEIQEVKEIVLRTEEQTKSNTEFIHAIKEIAKK